jgi:hypothetical protein
METHYGRTAQLSTGAYTMPASEALATPASCKTTSDECMLRHPENTHPTHHPMNPPPTLPTPPSSSFCCRFGHRQWPARNGTHLSVGFKNRCVELSFSSSIVLRTLGIERNDYGLLSQKTKKAYDKNGHSKWAVGTGRSRWSRVQCVASVRF